MSSSPMATKAAANTGRHDAVSGTRGRRVARPPRAVVAHVTEGAGRLNEGTGYDASAHPDERCAWWGRAGACAAEPIATVGTGAIKDGWLHTGDLGVRDARGDLYIRGRLRELINSGGFKIFPGDVEASLARHPAVAECAVFGVPDAKWGEAVNAAVVLRADGVATGEELITWVKSELGSVKAPKQVWFASAPRNAAGKVSRAAVRSALLE